MYVVAGVLAVGLVLVLALLPKRFENLTGGVRDSAAQSITRKEVEAETASLARDYKALVGLAVHGENYPLTFEYALSEWYDGMNHTVTGAQFPQEFESTIRDRYGKDTSITFTYRVESNSPGWFTFTVSIAPGQAGYDSKYKCSRTLIVTEADVDFSETGCYEY